MTGYQQRYEEALRLLREATKALDGAIGQTDDTNMADFRAWGDSKLNLRELSAAADELLDTFADAVCDDCGRGIENCVCRNPEPRDGDAWSGGFAWNH